MRPGWESYMYTILCHSKSWGLLIETRLDMKAYRFGFVSYVISVLVGIISLYIHYVLFRQDEKVIFSTVWVSYRLIVLIDW